jgi:Ser/Thr protein kinase RdoA (MazF antagonist)
MICNMTSITCDECGYTERHVGVGPGIIRQIQTEGWASKDGRDLCFSCQDPSKPRVPKLCRVDRNIATASRDGLLQFVHCDNKQCPGPLHTVDGKTICPVTSEEIKDADA